MYSFACTLLEMYTGRIPWHDFQSTLDKRRLRTFEGLVAEKVLESRRPTIIPADEKDGVPWTIMTIIRDCWKQEPRERTDIEEVVARMNTFVASGKSMD